MGCCTLARESPLVAGTMVYNVIEAVVPLWSGATAQSVALVGFGLQHRLNGTFTARVGEYFSATSGRSVSVAGGWS